MFPLTLKVYSHRHLHTSGGLNLTELLQHGLVYADSDPKFSQAIGISSILRNLDLLGNFQWEILINQFEDSAYFTSDYPIAIEASMDPDVLNKIVPLSPSLAIRILPNRKNTSRSSHVQFF